MNAAEKVGDWRVFSELAEERWNEERVPETELYAWGVKINEHCQDKSIRIKQPVGLPLPLTRSKKRKTGRQNQNFFL